MLGKIVLIIFFGTWDASGGKEIQTIDGFFSMASCQEQADKINKEMNQRVGQAQAICIEVKLR